MNSFISNSRNHLEPSSSTSSMLDAPELQRTAVKSCDSAKSNRCFSYYTTSQIESDSSLSSDEEQTQLLPVIGEFKKQRAYRNLFALISPEMSTRNSD